MNSDYLSKGKEFEVEERVMQKFIGKQERDTLGHWVWKSKLSKVL